MGYFFVLPGKLCNPCEKPILCITDNGVYITQTVSFEGEGRVKSCESWPKVWVESNDFEIKNPLEVASGEYEDYERFVRRRTCTAQED